MEFKTLHHNEWHTELNRFIKAYFEQRKQLVLQFIDALFGKATNIQEEVTNQRLKASNHLDYNASKSFLCLRNCRECSNVCVDLDGHASEHKCKTDHKCFQKCGICPHKRCSKQAGHFDFHYCALGKHLCRSNCTEVGCDRTCSKNHGLSQAISCKCSIKHRCQRMCELRSCHVKCSLTIEDHHSTHSCGNLCPMPCRSCGGKCSSEDHFHDLKTSLHLCNSHPARARHRAMRYLPSNELKDELRCDLY
jgi:hypothetical protein